MQKRVLTGITIFTAAVTAALILLLFAVPNLHTYARTVSNQVKESRAKSVLSLLQQNPDIVSVGGSSGEVEGGQLRMELPADVSTDSVSVTEDYLDRTIELEIPGLSQNYFYDFPMIGSVDHIENITYECEDGIGVIDITTDSIYELQMRAEDHYLYLDFLDPHQVYDKVVVIDAGHGGSAEGAIVGDVKEKDVNLQILLQLKELFDRCDLPIGVYYTRTEDVSVRYSQRVGLANDLKADLFLSIHNNSTSSGRISQINGAEVLYRVSDETGASREFAKNCLDGLLAETGAAGQGIVAGDEIYIIRSSQVPVALAEVGFMTNREELANLCDEEYQKRAAQGLYDAILKTLGYMQQ